MGIGPQAALGDALAQPPTVHDVVAIAPTNESASSAA